MIAVDTVRELLRAHGAVKPQPTSDWTGTIPLPRAIADFYLEVGPADITIASYGNPYFIPRLSKLWDFQAGYRWNGLTGEAIPEWDNDWIVAADEGGDPFIYSSAKNRVLFAHHGMGNWDPEDWFPDLNTMAACMAILGSVATKAGDHFLDADCFVRPEVLAAAVSQLAPIFGSREAAEEYLGASGWVHDAI